MLIRAQDIKPGYKLRTKVGNMIATAKMVKIMDEKRSLFTPAGADPMVLPGCVFVVFELHGKEYPYSFNIDEQVERAFINE